MQTELFQKKSTKSNDKYGNPKEYVLSAFKGYDPIAFWRNISAAKYHAINHILNQQNSDYIHIQNGMKVTLLFTAQGAGKRGQTVVYIDDNLNVYTCSSGKFFTEFSKI